jgi:mycofactocin system glycosyltransferase
MTSRYSLDPSVIRLEGGRVLAGGSPFRLLRLSAAGADLIDRIAAGDEFGVGLTGAAGRLVDRLVDAGMVHPQPGVDAAPYSTADVTVVIPVRHRPVDAVVASLGPVGRVLVVDDRSGAGPAAARNAGLAEVTTPLVAFVDSDCEATAGWLPPLLGHFADDRVVLVAPRIGPVDDGPGAIARYEAVRSPLDLGPWPGPVRPGSRIAYVPGAALVARTDAVRAVGGFDETLPTGEDVDLVWRFAARGDRLRYEPTAMVRHRHRVTVGPWLRRRVDYGASAASLARRHPGAAPPVAVSRWTAAAWGLALAGAPGAGASVAGVSVALLARRLRNVERPWAVAVRIAGLGNLRAGLPIGQALVRPWWPLTLAAALFSRRARRVAAVAALLPLLDWRTDRPALDPVRYLALRFLDDAAYSAGVWVGAWRERTLDPLLPAFPELLRRKGISGR